MELPTGSIIVSGPVIIEDGKGLLNKERKPSGNPLLFFPGGEVESFDITLEDACRREVKEEMGIEIELLKPLKPMMLHKNGRVVILIHFLARRIGEIKPGPEIAEWGWHDINKLPADCAPNVYEIINDYRQHL